VTVERTGNQTGLAIYGTKANDREAVSAFPGGKEGRWRNPSPPLKRTGRGILDLGGGGI